MPSRRTAMYSPEGIFPLGITHPSRPAAKLGSVRAHILFQGKKSFLNVPSAYSPEGIFHSEEPIHPGLSRNFTVILIIQKVSLRPGSVQSLQIAGVKRNVLFLQRASMRKLIKGKHEKRCSFLERKGDRRSRWIVDSTLFE